MRNSETASIVSRLKQLPTLNLVGLVGLVGFAPSACWIFVLAQFIPQPYRHTGDLFFGSVMFLTMGVLGLIAVVRRELYQGPIAIRGTAVLVMGTIMLLV